MSSGAKLAKQVWSCLWVSRSWMLQHGPGVHAISFCYIGETQETRCIIWLHYKVCRDACFQLDSLTDTSRQGRLWLTRSRKANSSDWLDSLQHSGETQAVNQANPTVLCKPVIDRFQRLYETSTFQNLGKLVRMYILLRAREVGSPVYSPPPPGQQTRQTNPLAC